jgi:hypothetical protein
MSLSREHFNRVRSCLRKAKYANRNRAEFGAAKLRINRCEIETFVVYKCEYCYFYHVGGTRNADVKLRMRFTFPDAWEIVPHAHA